MDRINRLRVFRLIVALMIVPNLVMAVIDIAGGHGYWVISAFAILFIAGALCFQTATIRRLERDEGSRGSLPVALLRVITGRKRPGCARIRELEIECELRGGQCTVTRPNGLCCIRDKHDDEWHRDGRGEPWRETPLRLIRVKPKVTGRKSVRIHGDAAAYWAYRNHED